MSCWNNCAGCPDCMDDKEANRKLMSDRQRAAHTKACIKCKTKFTEIDVKSCTLCNICWLNGVGTSK